MEARMYSMENVTKAKGGKNRYQSINEMTEKFLSTINWPHGGEVCGLNISNSNAAQIEICFVIQLQNSILNK